MTIKLSRNKNICTWETAGGDGVDLIQRQVNQQDVSGERKVGGGDRSDRIPGERNSDERLELRQTGGN